MALDGDEALYASILAHVERSELHDQLHKVVRKECKSINRHIRHATASLAALRQLKAASEHLRPRGDWLLNTLQTQLKNLEELQSSLETAVGHFAMNGIGKRTKKRKRPVETEKEPLQKEKEDCDDAKKGAKRVHEAAALETEVLEQEEDSDVEILEVVAPAERRVSVEEEKEIADIDRGDRGSVDVEVGTADSGEDAQVVIEEEDEEYEVEILEVVTADERRVEVEGRTVVNTMPEVVEVRSQAESGDGDAGSVSESEELPCGLVRISRDATIRIKDKPIPGEQIEFDREVSSQIHTIHKPVADDMAESPIELEVLESSEISDSEESAIELDAPDSDSEDEFSPWVVLVAKLQNANAADQLIKFPAVVEQLRTYLFDRKHLTATKLDGYLFAHKRITDEEADEIWSAIRTIVCVGMTLPLRPKIKLALYDLLATVEQLECTLGELPANMSSVVKKFTSYFLSQVDETADTVNSEPRFAVFHL